jgi:molybdopterin-guanine dinucleotide biosynthesis protein A
VSERPAASAIVLAGGRSTRFGRDKLAEPIAGAPLLAHAVRAVASVSREVLVLGRDGIDERAGPGRVPLRHVRDADPFSGPLTALATGLELAREPLAIVVAGDMPTLSPDVLLAMLRALDAGSGIEAACLVHRGRRQQLPLALRVGAGTSVARRLVGGGERRLGALLEALRARDLPETDWRPLDPAAATLRDVDRPEDLPR